MIAASNRKWLVFLAVGIGTFMSALFNAVQAGMLAALGALVSSVRGGARPGPK